MSRASVWRPTIDEAGSLLFFALLRALWLVPLLEIARIVWMPHLAAPLLPYAVILLLPVISQCLTRLLARGPGAARDLPVVSNVKLVIFGQCAVLLLMWLRFYRPEFSLVDPAWLQVLALRLVEGGEAGLAAWLSAGVATFLWVAGMADAFHGFTHHRVASTMRVGLVSFGFQAVTLRLEGTSHGNSLAISIVVFFGLCTMALALASTQVAGGLSVPLGARSPRTVLRMKLGWPWLSTTGSSIAAVLLLGLLGAATVSSQAVDLIVGASRALVRGTLQALLSAAAYLDGLLLPWLQSRRSDLEPVERVSGPEGVGALEGGRPAVGAIPQPAEVFTLGVILVICAALLVAAVAVLVFVRVWRPRVREWETPEIAVSAEIDWTSFRGLFRRGARHRARFARRRPFLSLEDESPGRRQVRQTYQSFLQEMARAGFPRVPDVAPSSYEVEARRALDAGQGIDEVSMDLDRLSRGYARVRYGGCTPDASEVAQVTGAWTRLREHVRRRSAGLPER